MNWWLWGIAASTALAIAQIGFRSWGLCWTSYLMYCAIVLGFTGWSLPLTYAKANTFWQPWFLIIAILNVYGFLISKLIYHDAFTLQGVAGIALTMLGGVLMIL
jgi:hypothetical protein